MKDKTKSPWEKYGYEDNDLSDIPDSTEDYRCPQCGMLHNIENHYNVDGIEYPQYYNEYTYSDIEGSLHEWDEVHRCINCGTIFKFRNGCF